MRYALQAAALATALSLAAGSAAAADYRLNPYTLAYEGAITENAPGEVSIHPVTYEVRRNGYQDTQLDTIQQRLQQASQARAQQAAGGEVQYSGDANLSDEQIAQLPFDLYRQGYEYYWKTHAHPGSTFRYTTSSLLDLMRFDATEQMALINQPLLMIAGSQADSLYMTVAAYAAASGTDDKEMALIDGATHIETYWVPKYVDAAVDKLTPFFARTLQ